MSTSSVESLVDIRNCLEFHSEATDMKKSDLLIHSGVFGPEISIRDKRGLMFNQDIPFSVNIYKISKETASTPAVFVDVSD